MLNIWKVSAAAFLPGVTGDKRFFRKKMICSVLLLISATCCISGAFEVSVTQSSYQAEENQNVTLEWRFTTKPGSSFKYLSVFCLLLTERKSSVLYHLHESVEVPESQDEQFAGRVQCDNDAFKDGRIRLLVSGLRTDDSGLYLCKVNTDYGMGTGTCQLDVTAPAERPRMRQEPENPRRPIIYAGMGVMAATALALFAKVCFGSFSSRDCDSPELVQDVYDEARVSSPCHEAHNGGSIHEHGECETIDAASGEKLRTKHILVQGRSQDFSNTEVK